MNPLSGLAAGLAIRPGPIDPLSAPGATPAAAAPAGAQGGLRFEGWPQRPGQATVLGEAVFNGDATDHRAIAQSILDSLFLPDA
jgi:hypothetical protein